MRSTRQPLAPKADKVFFEANRGLRGEVAKDGAGKLKRQVGTTNLRMGNQNGDNFKNNDLSSARQVESVKSKDAFEVFQDSDVKASNSYLDDIDQLARQRKEQAQRKEKENAAKVAAHQLRTSTAVLRTRIDVELSSNVDYLDPPSLGSFYDDEEEIAPPQSGATSIRSGLSNIRMLNEKEDDVSSQYESAPEDFKDKNSVSSYVSSLAQRELKEDIFYNNEEYFKDIFRYMCDRQTKIRASSKYMNKQEKITADMRKVLIDWFHDVAVEYDFQQETLHLAVSLVDRFMSKFQVDGPKLQLIGTTALMIAAKYEEIYPPELKNFSAVTDDTFSTEQILNMERFILEHLKFVVSAPTTSWFATMMAKRLKMERQAKFAMEYLVNLSLMHYETLIYRPSHVAAACICYANILTGTEPWPISIAEDTGFRLQSFAKIMPDLHQLFSNAGSSSLISIYTHYSDVAREKVALLDPPSQLPDFGPSS